MDFSNVATLIGMPVEELAKMLGLMAVVSFILLLFMGLTNKVVIFVDGKDLITSLGIIVIPIIGFLILLYFKPGNATADYDMFFGSNSSTAVVVIAGLSIFYCILMTYVQAVKCNNLVLGIVVGTFKVISALIMTLFAIGWLNKMFGEQNRTIGTWIVMTLMLGLFAWVVRKMVNGEAVTLKRLQSQQVQAS